MLLQGKIKTWNDERGYGFVEQNGTGLRAFLHVSAFSTRTKRPVEGDMVTFKIEPGPKGLRAVNVTFVGHSRGSIERSTFSFVGLVVSLLFVCVVGYVLSIRMTHPGSTIQASVYKAVIDRSALKSDQRFTCAGKSQCSQMTSCAEAFFYRERCDASEMDGDHDGIPCEQQWCQ